jgi:hypothetical protein
MSVHHVHLQGTAITAVPDSAKIKGRIYGLEENRMAGAARAKPPAGLAAGPG